MHPESPIHLEFFGIPRRRAGCEAISVTGRTLRDVLRAAVAAAPGLAELCEDGCLKPGYAANRNGREFLADGDTLLEPGDHVLLFSADLGG